MLLMKFIFFLISVNLFVTNCYGFLDVLVGIGSYVYQSTCFSGECCTKHGIPAKFDDLQFSLESNLYGQPLVQNTILRSLKSHWNGKHKPTKALALSFHGGTGVGKNYVSQFIQEALYLLGTKSPHTHTFVARLDFPEESKVDLYKKNLANWIRGNVSLCPRQLFIFDEVNHMPRGILDVIKPFIDYVDYVNGVSYTEAIFLFLSNTGANVINEHAYYLFKKGIDRSKMKLRDFENLIITGAFNENGGFQHSDNIKSDLIDHYIPFLPLMKPHIENCIRKEFKKHGYSQPSESSIREVLNEIDWAPDAEKVFAKTGCKRISQRVGVLV